MNLRAKRISSRRLFRRVSRVKLHSLATPALTMYGRQVLADCERHELEESPWCGYWGDDLDGDYYDDLDDALDYVKDPAPLTFKVREVADLYPKNYAAGDAFMAIFGFVRAA